MKTTMKQAAAASVEVISILLAFGILGLCIGSAIRAFFESRISDGITDLGVAAMIYFVHSYAKENRQLRDENATLRSAVGSYERLVLRWSEQ